MIRQITEKVEHFEGEGEQYFSKQAKCGWCELVCKFVKTKFNRLKTKYVFLCNLYYISFSRINQMIREITGKVEDFEGEGVSNIFQIKQNMVSSIGLQIS